MIFSDRRHLGRSLFEGVPCSEIEETSRCQPMVLLEGTALAVVSFSSWRLTMATRRVRLFHDIGHSRRRES